jgi:hypothetical protein
MVGHDSEMIHQSAFSLLALEGGPSQHLPGEVVEVPLLLSAGQMSALETAAHRHGVTAGEMVRRLLHHYIAESPANTQLLTGIPAQDSLS